MSVNWKYILVVPMPTALTQMAASTAYVGKALKVMDSTVQVNNYTGKQLHRYNKHSTQIQFDGYQCAKCW